MDSNVNGVRPGGIYGVQPTGKRKREEDAQKKPFSVEKEEKPAAPDAQTSTENLVVSEREEDESGGTLDLTA